MSQTVLAWADAAGPPAATCPADHRTRSAAKGGEGMTLDPVTLTVIQAGLVQVCNEMDIAFSRAAFSPVIAEANDRSDGIYALNDGALIAQGELGLPIFVGTMQDSVGAVIAKIDTGATAPPEPDDVYIVNDPYLGGTHLMDVRFIKPFFHQGEHWCWLANTGHWPDIGGAVPGGFSASATEIEQEGLRLPPVKLFKRGVMDPEIYAIVMSNIRVADQRIGDIKAQAAALEVGAQRLTALLDRYGRPDRRGRDRRAACRRPQGRCGPGSGSCPTAATRAPPGSTATASSTSPWPSAHRHQGRDTLTFDLTQSSPPCQGPMNSVIATTRSSIYLAVKHIWPEVPINAGLFEPLVIIEPRGTFLYAEYPRPVSGCAAEVSQRIAEAVFAALVQAAPDRVTAAPAGTSGNFASAASIRPGTAATSCTTSPAAAMAATPRPTASATAARPSASPSPPPSRSWSSNTPSCSRNTRSARIPAVPGSTGAAWASATPSPSGAGRQCQLRHGPRPLRPPGRARRRGRRAQQDRDPLQGRPDRDPAAPLQGAEHPHQRRRHHPHPNAGRRRLRRPGKARPALVARDKRRGYVRGSPSPDSRSPASERPGSQAGEAPHA
jgi:hypothetical protein